MKLITLVAGLGLVAGLVMGAGAVGPCPEDELTLAARRITADDAEARAAALGKLEAAKQAGLDALMREQAGVIARGPQASDGRDSSENPGMVWERLTYALDRVGHARDTYSAGLFWYTDLEEAKAAARAAKKPILSLRLLGNLDEEYSCANSRYFRTALYANKEVSAYLHDHYVLHWKSQRRVPTVTIDFGDGRKIERTITGNSVHYVLDSEGSVVDALPGLYGPGVFLRTLKSAERVAAGASNPMARREYAAAEARAIGEAWRQDLKVLGVVVAAALPAARGGAAPDVDRRTASKSAVERPILAEIFPGAAMKAATDGAGWERLAARHPGEAALDEGSLRLMRDKSAVMRAFGGEPSDSPMAAAFRSALALDTVKNEYLMHRAACEWLALGRGVGLESLNTRVYSELFATPDSDEWLGLLPSDVYVGLDGDGVRNEPAYRRAGK